MRNKTEVQLFFIKGIQFIGRHHMDLLNNTFFRV